MEYGATMRKKTAIQHFGTELEIARALKISRQAVNKWPAIVPEGAAYKLQVLTGGRLQVDQSCYISNQKPRP
jgi:hypothetical protein